MIVEKSVRLTAVYMALIGCAFIYGAWHLMANIAMTHGAPPLIFAVYRCLGGSEICLLALWLFPDLGTKTIKQYGKSVMGDYMVERNGYSARDEVRFMILGLLMAGNICGFILANAYLPALTCSIFQPVVPVVALLVSILLGHEEGSRDKFVSVILCVVGASSTVVFGHHPPAPAAMTTMTTVTTMALSTLPGGKVAKLAALGKVANTSAKAVTNLTAMGSVANATAAMTLTNATMLGNAANATAKVVANTTALTKVSSVVTRVAPTLATGAATSVATATASHGHNHVLLGTAFLCMNVVCSGLYYVLVKDVLRTYTPVHATALVYGHSVAVAFAVALAYHGFDLQQWLMFGDATSWACLVYCAIMATGVTYTIQAWAVGETSANTVSAFGTLSPIAAGLLSSAFLAVHPSPAQLFGGLAIVAGLYLNISSQVREHAEKEAHPLRNYASGARTADYSSL